MKDEEDLGTDYGSTMFNGCMGIILFGTMIIVAITELYEWFTAR